MVTHGRTQELKLVFALNDPTNSSEMTFGADKIKLLSRTGSVAPIDALNILVATMQKLDIDAIFMERSKPVSISTLKKRVETKGTWGHLETVGLSLQYGVAASYDHCFALIREKVANAAGDWDMWANPFVGLPGFVEGWVVDVDYNHWQNAKDPIEYEAAGRDFSHLPMKSNGLPFPLEQMEIDVSRNPGRWVLRSGYVEAIGSTMWLSELFWQRVGRNSQAFMNAAGWVQANELAMGILKIQIPAYYSFPEEAEEIQNRLRACLYG
jgi:hypothetical protein